MGIFDAENILDRLFNLVNKEQVNLSKLLITLATGVIVFSYGLVKPATYFVWMVAIIFGLSLLVFSIMLGVLYIKACLDGQGHQLRLRLRKIQIDASKDASEKEKLNASKKDLEDKLNKTSNKEEIFYLWQARLFYSGLILVTIYGIFTM